METLLCCSRVKALIAPDKVVIGGQTDEKDKYIAPTVLANVTFNDNPMKEEVVTSLFSLFHPDVSGKILIPTVFHIFTTCYRYLVPYYP